MGWTLAAPVRPAPLPAASVSRELQQHDEEVDEIEIQSQRAHQRGLGEITAGAGGEIHLLDHISQPRARDPEFQRIVDEARASGRATLRRLQWQRANGGADTMLIWLGKQMLGQKDKVETEATNTHHNSGAFVLGKGDPAEIAQAYRRIIDGTLDDES